MVHKINITTSRLNLREWRADEGEAFHRWVADPVVNRFLLWAASTRDESENQLTEAVDAQEEEPRTKCFLEPARWGQGLAREAAQAVIDLAFSLEWSCGRHSCRTPIHRGGGNED